MNMRIFAKLALVGALSTVSLPALAHGHDHHHGRRDHCREGRSHAPAGGWRSQAPVRQVWVPGHWVRRGGAHVWLNASWAVPPQPAWVWVEPQWVWNGGSWQWREAHWAPPTY